MLARAVVVMALFVCSSASTAAADDVGTARDHYKKATKAFDLGFYEEAVKEYMAAYQAKDDPVILYNIAQAHRLANHPAEALRFYRIFLTKVPRAENRAEVEAKVAELVKVLEQLKRAQEMPPNQPLPATPKVETAHVEPKPDAKPAVKPQPEPKPETQAMPLPDTFAAPPPPAPTGDGGRTKKIAGGVVLGIGVAAAAAGGALAALASSTGDEVTTAARTMQRWDPDKHASGELYQTTGLVLLGVGGAAVLAGVVVIVLGVRDGKAAKRASLVPVLSPQVVGASMELSF
jgi:tetratricopeptide (TPR) repeat protein